MAAHVVCSCYMEPGNPKQNIRVKYLVRNPIPLGLTYPTSENTECSSGKVTFRTVIRPS